MILTQEHPSHFLVAYIPLTTSLPARKQTPPTWRFYIRYKNGVYIKQKGYTVWRFLFRRLINMRNEIMIQSQIGLIRWMYRLRPRQPQNQEKFIWQKLKQVSYHVYMNFMNLQINIYHCYVKNNRHAVRQKMISLLVHCHLFLKRPK